MSVSPFRASRGHVDHASPLDLEAIRRSVRGMYVEPPFHRELVAEVERLRADVARREQRARRIEQACLVAFVALMFGGLLYASCCMQMETP